MKFNINTFYYLFILLVSWNNSFSQTNKVYKGTTVAVIMKNDTVWIGADSKISYDFDTLEIQRCKILMFKDFAFAHLGLTTIPQINFDVNVVIENIQNRTENIDQIKFEMNKSMYDILNKIGDNYIKENPHYLEFNSGSQIVEFNIINLFCYFKNDISFVDEFRYRVFKISNTEIEIKLDTLSRKSNIYPSLEIYGEREDSWSYMNEHPNYRYNENPVTIINKIIAIEATFRTKDVGLPCDILRVSSKNFEWIQCKEHCR